MISILMTYQRIDRPNAELLAFAADLAQRFSAAVIGIVAAQFSAQPAMMAVGPGEPRDHDLDSLREGVAAVEAEFRQASPTRGAIQT
jgi:hypothetical protein